MALRSPRSLSHPTPEHFDLASRKAQMDPSSPLAAAPQRTSFVKAHYHPFLFALMTFSAVAELGLTAFLISAGNEHRTWPSPRYHSLYVVSFQTLK